MNESEEGTLILFRFNKICLQNQSRLLPYKYNQKLFVDIAVYF